MLNQSVIDLNEMSFRANSIYCGDCKDILSHFHEGSVDLIYLDPPFFSNQVYQEIWKDGYEIRGFEDRWKGGLDEYLEWMKERLLQCHKVLKDTGSIFLHCDYRANHYLKIFVMDKIFSPENFRNEIIWHYQGWGRKLKGAFKWHYDTILFYSKTQNNKFHSYSIPWESKKQMAKRRRQLIRAEENGREYIMDQRRGRTRKLYVDEIMARGQPVDSIWDINRLNYEDKENLGYPTQKPEALLERIINSSSDPMDIVLDPFCGCGTAIAAAHKLGRQWIGIDISPTACKLMADRIRKLGVNDVRITNLPFSLDELRSIKPVDFQNWVVEKLHGRASPRRMHDMGIDGYDYENTPIQVKQSDNVGRNVVDNFVAAIQREGSQKGIIVAFGFGGGAYNEAARLKHPISKYQQPLEIILMSVNQLVNPSNVL